MTEFCGLYILNEKPSYYKEKTYPYAQKCIGT